MDEVNKELKKPKQQQQSQLSGLQVLINFSEDFWQNFSGYENQKIRNIQENSNIPQSIKIDMIKNLQKKPIKKEQQIKLREVSEIVKDKNLDFEGKVLEIMKNDLNNMQLGWILSGPEGTVNILPNQEYLDEQKRLKALEDEKKLQSNKKKTYRRSQFMNNLNSQHLVNKINKFLDNMSSNLNKIPVPSFKAITPDIWNGHILSQQYLKVADLGEFNQ